MAFTVVYDSSSETSLAALGNRLTLVEQNKAPRSPEVFAQVELDASVIIAQGDTFAQSGWSATTNIGGSFKKSNETGTGTGYSRFIIPITGRYEINWRMILNSGAGATRTAMKMTRNGRDIPTQTIMTDSATKNGEGDDFHLYSWWCDRLSAGDVLYFSTYAAGGNYALVKSTFTGAKSNIQLQYRGNY